MTSSFEYPNTNASLLSIRVTSTSSPDSLRQRGRELEAAEARSQDHDAQHRRLERDVAVLARRARLALRDRGPQRVDQHGPRAPRLDHLVDVAALGRGVRVREALLVVGDQLGAPRLRIVGLGELVAGR